MNKIPKFIKGALLSLLAIAMFSLSVSPALEAANGNTPNTAAYELSIGNQAFAQANNAGSGSGSGSNATTPSSSQKPKEAAIPEDTVKSIATKAQIIFKIFHPAIFFFTKHISNLMGTDLIYAGGMGEMLQKIWVVNRNIVNIAFVLILLFMALKYIFGSEENTDLKKLLPTFAIALIAVNFTWLGGKLIIDAANVATNVVFAIPKGMGPVKTIAPEKLECKIKPDHSGTEGYGCSPKELYFPTKATKYKHMLASECESQKIDDRYKVAYGGLKTTDGSSSGENKNSPYYGTATYCWENLDLAKFDNTNAAFHLTYGMARVQNLPVAKANESIGDVLISTIFAFIIELVYLLSFLAVFIALIFRIAMLWILVAFSPFIVLLMFLGKLGQNGESEVSKYLSLKAFGDWAFAPTRVAAVWAVGFIMISAGQLTTGDILAKIDAQGKITSKAYQVSSLFNGIETLQDLMWLLMTIIIIWIGTFAALSKLEIAKPILDKIQQTGSKVAKFAATAPLWAPILPTIDPNTGKMDWKNRTSFTKMHKDTMGMMDSYMGGTISPKEEVKALKTFKGRSGAEIAQLKALADKPKELAQKMSTLSGLSLANLANRQPADLTKFLQEHSSINADEANKLAPKIIQGAKGEKGKTYEKVSAKPPTTPTAKPLTQAEVETAFGNALDKHNLKGEITRLKPELEKMLNGKVRTKSNVDQASSIVAEEAAAQAELTAAQASTAANKTELVDAAQKKLQAAQAKKAEFTKKK